MSIKAFAFKEYSGDLLHTASAHEYYFLALKKSYWLQEQISFYICSVSSQVPQSSTAGKELVVGVQTLLSRRQFSGLPNVQLIKALDG